MRATLRRRRHRSVRLRSALRARSPAQAGSTQGRYNWGEGNLHGNGRLAWLATVALVGGVTVATLFGPGERTQVREPANCCSASSSVSAVACIVGATIVIALADRRELAELGLLGSALMAASVMPLVHGLVTPGVLYNDTAAFRTSAFLSLPVARRRRRPAAHPALDVRALGCAPLA